MAEIRDMAFEISWYQDWGWAANFHAVMMTEIDSSGQTETDSECLGLFMPLLGSCFLRGC